MTYDILFRMKNNQQYLTLHVEGNVSIMKNPWENLGELLRPKTFVQLTLLQIRFSPINFLYRTTSANICRNQSSEGCSERSESVSSLMKKVRADLP